MSTCSSAARSSHDGKPPHYRTQQRGFLRFLEHSGHQADYISDEDLEKVATGDELAQRYDLIIFSGHEEYVTQHIYDVTQRYRDLGGNLAFLSADNFFWRVDRDRLNRIWRVKLWRDLGRPEAALIGVQYSGNDRGGHAQPYVIQNRETAPWLFDGLDIPDGATLGTVEYGIEFDKTAPESPPGTEVLASVDPGLQGRRGDRADDVLRAERREGVRGGDARLRRLRQPDRDGAVQESLESPRRSLALS